MDSGSGFTEQLHRSYDFGIAGQYVSCNSKYLLKDDINSVYRVKLQIKIIFQHLLLFFCLSFTIKIIDLLEKTFATFYPK